MSFHLEPYLKAQARVIEREMRRILPAPQAGGVRVSEAMRHAVLAGGKRLRPILVLAGARAAGARASKVLPLALAYECLHTYSLVHDDLPAMDDDDLRRGLPTCHKKFGEAVAILAGDALHSLAFELISQSPLPPEKIQKASLRLARAAGTGGMVGGQALDLAWAGRKLKPRDLERLHGMKTGALIAAAAAAGAEAAGAPPVLVGRLEKYGRLLGLAFQVVDDILDVEGSAKTLGKTPGKDRKKKLFTYVNLLGLKGAKALARSLSMKAQRALPPKASFGPLRALAQFVVDRAY